MGRARKKGRLDFEASLNKLEQIVHRLEDEQVPLEESLKLFAEGKELAKRCEVELQEAENRVRQLLADEDGEVVEAPLDELDPAKGESAAGLGDGSTSSGSSGSGATRDDLPF